MMSPSRLRSRPSIRYTGSAERKRKNGATRMPQGACQTADALKRCRASVVRFGPNCRGSSNGLFGSWMLAVFSSSVALPMLLLPLDSVYDAVKSSPLRQAPLAPTVISALYSLWPRLTAGRLPLEFGLSVGTQPADAGASVDPPPMRWLTRGRKFRSPPIELT